MKTLAVIIWWALGTSSMLWLRRGDNVTWGDLALCSLVGLLGPFLWAVIIFVIVVQLDFWSEPIFRKKRQE